MSSSRKLWTWVALGLVALVCGAALWAWPRAPRRKPPREPDYQIPVSWQNVRASPMHSAHVDGARLACTECHEDGFDQRPDTKVCGKCHEAQGAYAHAKRGPDPTTCLTCHAFGERPAMACRQCHSGQQGAVPALSHHVRADVACNACHGVHGEPQVVLAACTTCHRGVGVKHGAFAVAPPDPAFAPDASASLLAADGGTRTLEDLREGGAPAAPFVVSRAGPPPIDVPPLSAAHALPGQVCSQCHAPHAAKEAARAACAACHVLAERVRTAAPHAAPPADRPGPMLAALAAVAPAVDPHGKDVAGHPACVTCHEPHAVQRSAVRACEGCHGERRTAAAVVGHFACAGCHAPHAPAEAERSCTKCHQGSAALGAAKVPQHAVCTSCHDPHRPELSPSAACARCHADVHPAHPIPKTSEGGAPVLASRVATQQATGACVGCHAPHPKPGASSAAPCSACHRDAKSDRAFHGRGAVSCGQCHAPHAFDAQALGTSLCARCHQPMAKVAVARPGHADCKVCHGASHAPVAKPPCASCHAQQTSTAPKGHAACTACHDAHSGSLGARRDCTSCHADKASAPHGALSGAGCAQCHRAHGPKGVDKPPGCASCHAPAKLPGLHAVAAHAASRCEQCHGPHSPPKADRSTCTATCHVKQRNHQTGAQLCKGCHVFRK
jgi:hypothetical protein